MKKILGLLVTAFMLMASALAADLDTPQIGAAICAPEEADGSVVLHEAPDGRSETLMRYFQGAPLQVLDLADGWAHVRMGMEGDSLEGYIRQERLKYGAEAMREITQYASMPGFESDVIIYQACDEQSDIVEAVQGPCGIKIMGYNGQWAAIWGRNGFIPYDVVNDRPDKWDSVSYPVLPLDGEITVEEAERIFREEVRQKRTEWGLCAEYDDEKLLNEEIQWDCSGVSYEPWRSEASYRVFMMDPMLFNERTSTFSALFAEISTTGEIQKVYNWMPQSGTAVCAPEEDHLEWYVAVGTEVERLSMLPQCYKDANHYFAYRFIKPGLHVLSETTLSDCLAGQGEKNIGTVDFMQMDPEIIRDFLSRGEDKEIHDFVESYLYNIQNALKSRMFRSYVILNIRFAVVAFLESIGADQAEYLEEIEHAVQMIRSEDSEIFEYFAGMLETAMGIRDRINSCQGGKMLKKALDYIDDHYDCDTLSLNLVAENIGMSASYLSAIFSQNMQKTFVEYVTEKRIEKAKKLLKQTDKNSGEIAKEVGYKDSHYFSFVFKKLQGCSPREYRAEKKH